MNAIAHGLGVIVATILGLAILIVQIWVTIKLVIWITGG